MYGGDRLTTPLLRRGRRLRKGRRLTPVSRDEAFNAMAARAKAVLKDKVRRRSACRLGSMDSL
jgi:nitrate reductase NapA